MSKLTPKPGEQLDRFSARALEPSILARVQDPTTQFRCIVLTGHAGSGVRTLATVRLPALLDESNHAELFGEWPGEPHPVLLCPDPARLPRVPPPEKFSRSTLILVCSGLVTLPKWVSALPSNAREVFQVSALSLTELHDFLAARLGAPADTSTARSIGAACGFVPGVITALLRVLVNGGWLARLEQIWTLTAPLDAQAFTAHVHAQISDLEPNEQVIFHRICLQDPAPLAEFTPSEHALARILTDRGLIQVSEDAFYTVRAPIISQAGRLLADSQLVRSTYKRALESDEVPEHIVSWALNLGRFVSVKTLLVTIDRALARHDWSAAEQLSAVALECVGEIFCPTPQQQAEIYFARATALRFLDDPDEALAAVEAAGQQTKLLASPHADRIRGKLAVLRAEVIHYTFGQLDAAIDSLNRASHKLTDTQAHADLFAHQLIHLYYGGEFRRASAFESKHSELIHKVAPDLRIRIRICEALALSAQGHPHRGLKKAVRLGVQRNFSRRKAPWVTEELSAAYFVCSFSSEGPAQSPRLFQQFETQRTGRYEPDNTTFQLAHASWLLANGKVFEADRAASLAYAAAEFHDPSGLIFAVVALRALTAALTNQPDSSRRMLNQLTNEPIRSSAIVFGGALHNSAAAGFLLEQAGAGDELIQAATLLHHAESSGFAAEAAHAGVRFGHVPSAQLVAKIAPGLGGSLFRLRVDHARAVINADPVALAEVAKRFTKAGLALFAAEAYALALNCKNAPAATQRRARHGLSTLQDRFSLLTHQLLAPHFTVRPPELTPREAQVQELIVVGLSNQEIADRLHLSLRTIEGHIGRLYQKTGDLRRSPTRRNI